MQQALSDTELVKAARRGERSSFALLFERYEPSLYASALKMLGQRAPARDAVQDTFLTALGNLTIIEGAFQNPPHDPHHCPPEGVFVLFHRGGEVYRVHIHYGIRE